MDLSAMRKTRQLVTIVTEAIIEHAILEDLERLGVKGYTITEARGKGSRGVREADWMASGNIRIEIVCNQELADKVIRLCTEQYYQNYAMIMYLSEVAVLRPEKF